MHSTGLKTKGDNVTLDMIPYDSSETFGNCTDCEYYPIVSAARFDPPAFRLHVRGVPAAASDLVSEGWALESLWRQPLPL